MFQSGTLLFKENNTVSTLGLTIFQVITRGHVDPPVSYHYLSVLAGVQCPGFPPYSLVARARARTARSSEEKDRVKNVNAPTSGLFAGGISGAGTALTVF